MLWYALCVTVRVHVVLFLLGLVTLLNPIPDPFIQVGLLLLVVVAVSWSRRVRRGVLRWVVGVPPVTRIEATAGPVETTAGPK